MGSHKKRRKPSTSSDTETTSDEDSSPQRRKRSRSSKKKKTPKKRKHVSSSSDTSTDTSSSSEAEKKKSKKKKQKKKPKEKKIEKTEEASSDIPLDLMARSKSMAPVTKEEWEKRQSVVRRVYDETTGRHRLIKGDGEVVEEIVSRDRHKTINQQATRGDGDFFQAKMTGHLKK